MSADDSFPITSTALNQGRIVACGKSCRVSKRNVRHVASGTRIVAGMQKDHGDVATNALIPVPKATAANKQELAMAYTLSCNDPWVLDSRNCGVKVVPILSKTGVRHLTLVIAMFFPAHIYMSRTNAHETVPILLS